MKWTQPPAPPCARPDCVEPARQWSYCMRHSGLYRRHGSPYTLAEQEDMQAAEEIQREMDALLEASPPVITWANRGGVLVAARIDDPHTEHPRRETAA